MGGKRHGGQKVGGQKVGGQKTRGQKTGGQKTGGQKSCHPIYHTHHKSITFRGVGKKGGGEPPFWRQILNISYIKCSVQKNLFENSHLKRPPPPP